MSVKCFFIEPSETVIRYYRRYESGNCQNKGEFDYHNSKILRDEIKVPVSKGKSETDPRMVHELVDECDISLFPTHCDKCGFQFTENSKFQLTSDRLYYSKEKNDYFSLSNLPPGAMYYADWMLHENSNLFRGPDGHSLIVILPNGNPWTIDGPANNCTEPKDYDHRCWVRHGEVPNITVDKNGNTCAAGAGSIQSGDYHGFLRNGELT